LGRTYKAILNYGIKPTINGINSPVAEAHIIGFDEDIYGEKIKILISNMIRKEQKFGSLIELKNQIEKDIQAC